MFWLIRFVEKSLGGDSPVFVCHFFDSFYFSKSFKVLFKNQFSEFFVHKVFL